MADLLWLDGHSTVDLPYRDRRSLLEGLGFDDAPVWTTSPLPVSELATMLRIADAKGVDALHARHLGSRYKPGGRSPLWVKVPVPRVREVVIGGWTPTDAAPAGRDRQPAAGRARRAAGCATSGGSGWPATSAGRWPGWARCAGTGRRS